LRDHETNFSAQHPPTKKEARIPQADVLAGRTDRVEAAPRQGPQAPLGVTPGPEAAAKRRYPKQARLCAQKDIDRVFRDGRYRRLGTLHAKVLANGLPGSRFLVSVKRKIGKAHQRNRLRRLVREAIRLNRPQLQGGYDVCFFLTSAPERPSLAALEAEVRKLFRELSQSQSTDKQA